MSKPKSRRLGEQTGGVFHHRGRHGFHFHAVLTGKADRPDGEVFYPRILPGVEDFQGGPRAKLVALADARLRFTDRIFLEDIGFVR
jgi:hypothetical protein